MPIVLTSPSALLRQGSPDRKIVQVLAKASLGTDRIAVVSNNAEPAWFQESFAGSRVQFLHQTGRQSGRVVAENAAKFSLKPFDVLVVAATADDIQMGKNGGAVLVAAGWSTPDEVLSLGIRVDSAEQLRDVLSLTRSWPGTWWFSGDGGAYKVRALADLSSYGKEFTQQAFAQKLTDVVKNGGPRLNALLAVTARSLMVDGVHTNEGLVWGVYPSSDSGNDDAEILSDFTHRLRTTVSRVRYAQRGTPLFIRHTASPKRSAGMGGDRTDPTSQITTMHLNPFYRDHRLRGKNVVVVDDCTTYGASFGVAAALLRAAGAASVTGVALGKFGHQLRSYDISINSDPFSPITEGSFVIDKVEFLTGASCASTQQALQSLIP